MFSFFKTVNTIEKSTSNEVNNFCTIKSLWDTKSIMTCQSRPDFDFFLENLPLVAKFHTVNIIFYSRTVYFLYPKDFEHFFVNKFCPHLNEHKWSFCVSDHLLILSPKNIDSILWNKRALGKIDKNNKRASWNNHAP